MPETETRERLAKMLEEMKARNASYMTRIDAERDAEEQIVLSRAKQDYEKTAEEEYAEIQGKLRAREEQARIQGELREMAFADQVRHPNNPKEDVFLEKKYLNKGYDGRYFLSMNGYNLPVEPDTINSIPWQFAEDYKSKMKSWAYLKKIEEALSVGSYDRPPGKEDFKTHGEFEFLLQKARHGKL